MGSAVVSGEIHSQFDVVHVCFAIGHVDVPLNISESNLAVARIMTESISRKGQWAAVS